jgi:hypothetical protein
LTACAAAVRRAAPSPSIAAWASAWATRIAARLRTGSSFIAFVHTAIAWRRSGSPSFAGSFAAWATRLWAYSSAISSRGSPGGPPFAL